MKESELLRRTFMRRTSLMAAGIIAGALTGQGCALSKKTKLLDTSKIDTSRILNYNPHMGYRRLGKTGLVVSEISLGGHFNNPEGNHFWNKFANDEVPDEVAKNRTDVVSKCIDYGINYLDITYSGECLAYGVALKGRREKMYVGADDGELCMRREPFRNVEGQMKNIEACLRRLQTDYLDIWRPQFIMAGGQPDRAIQVCIETFEKAHAQGKVRWLGMSSHNRAWIQHLVENFPQYSMVIFPYTVKSKVKPPDIKSIDPKRLYEPGSQEWWLTDTRKGLFEVAQDRDVGVVTIKSFSAGLIFSSPRPAFGKPFQRNAEDDELARLTLAYILCNPYLTATVVGMTLLSEVDNNIRASAERLALLDQDGMRKVAQAANRMWANLPDEYRWLRDWEWV